MKDPALLGDAASAASLRLPGSSLAGAATLELPKQQLDAQPAAARRRVPLAVQTAMVEGHARMQPRIVNGSEDSGQARFPFAARLKWQLAANASKRCTGSLITPSHILTSAHVSLRRTQAGRSSKAQP